MCLAPVLKENILFAMILLGSPLCCPCDGRMIYNCYCTGYLANLMKAHFMAPICVLVSSLFLVFTVAILNEIYIPKNFLLRNQDLIIRDFASEIF